MKLVKMSIVALSMGLFLASCGGNTEETTPAVDSVAVEAPMVEEVATPVADSAAMMTDTTAAPAAEEAAH